MEDKKADVAEKGLAQAAIGARTKEWPKGA